MTKKELKEAILLVSKIGVLELSGLSINDIDTPKKCYNLYYGGGGTKIRIWKEYDNYNSKLNHVKITEETIDKIVDEVYECVTYNIHALIKQALLNIGEDGEYETLKYFDRDEKLFIKFKEEVLKLKKEKDVKE